MSFWSTKSSSFERNSWSFHNNIVCWAKLYVLGKKHRPGWNSCYLICFDFSPPMNEQEYVYLALWTFHQVIWQTQYKFMVRYVAASARDSSETTPELASCDKVEVDGEQIAQGRVPFRSWAMLTTTTKCVGCSSQPTCREHSVSTT